MKNTFKTLEEAIENIRTMKKYKPFEYSGKWYFATIGNKSYARRTRSSLNAIAVKAGLLKLEISILF